MAEKEMQAHDNLRRKNWSRAVCLYDQILTNTQQIVTKTTPSDRILACLLGRSQCYIELNKFENCVQDSLEILTILGKNTDCFPSLARTKRRLIYSYYRLDKLEVIIVKKKNCNFLNFNSF